MHHVFEIKTSRRTQLIDITNQVLEIIKNSDVKNGTAILYAPHTTAAITINENYDPSVTADIIESLDRLIPSNLKYLHSEGNADAHIKAALIGSSQTIFFENNQIIFGTWQGIFFCEFDGPRKRKILVKILPE